MNYVLLRMSSTMDSVAKAFDFNFKSMASSLPLFHVLYSQRTHEKQTNMIQIPDVKDIAQESAFEVIIGSRGSHKTTQGQFQHGRGPLHTDVCPTIIDVYFFNVDFKQ